MTDIEAAAGADPVETEPPAGEPGVSRRELAVARSLFTARARAETRLQRFLDAALELMNEGGPGSDFTVHEVVERSGQSLRLFYQYFGGKHELLLALFEESVRWTTDYLEERIAGADDPMERIHQFVVEYYRLCRPPHRQAETGRGSTVPVMTDFAQQLLTSHPAEAALAFAPLVSMFGELLDEADAAGQVRPGLRRSPIAGMVLEAVMFNAFASTISGTSAGADDRDPAEELWDFIVRGVGTGDHS